MVTILTKYTTKKTRRITSHGCSSLNMTSIVFFILALMMSHMPLSFAAQDPIPFGKDRLQDFFFIQNGTLFRQFVMMICHYFLSNL